MTINCNGKLIELQTPKIMGILNLTEDSFYDGGKHNSILKAIKQTEKMLNEGATIIDIGAQSTRPNAKFISSKEEWKLLKDVVNQIIKNFPEAIFSIDTFWSEVAENCINEGFSMINDISGGNIDDKMFETVRKLKVPYVLMHIKGTPQTMQQNVDYDNIIKDINFYFAEKIQKLKSFGLNDLILDVGFGFSKTVEQNYELLSKLELIGFAHHPILVGISRKSMIYKTLNINAKDALNGTTALHLVALQKGAKILRVHDVKEAKECITLYETLEKYKNE